MRTAHQLPEASSKGWPRHWFPMRRSGIPSTGLGHVILQLYAGLLNATHLLKGCPVAGAASFADLGLPAIQGSCAPDSQAQQEPCLQCRSIYSPSWAS